MQRATWTYELPIGGSAAEILDDYEACSEDGGHLGVVTGLVRRDDDLYVLLDAGRMPPLLHRRLAVPLADVAEIDHDALVVRLSGDRGRLEQTALELDPALARRDSAAEAVRVAALPPALAARPAHGGEGPLERNASVLMLAAATLSPFSLFLLVALWDARGYTGWEYGVLAIPLLFALLAVAAAGYRLYREPHAGHHPQPVVETPRRAW